MENKCDNCIHYHWYYDYCDKWNCEVDERETCNCFEQQETPVRDAMVNNPKNGDSGICSCTLGSAVMYLGI